MVGLLAGTPASICRRARLQDRTTVCMACSAFFVISRICRSVISISLRGAALVSSFATSCTAANMARILPRSSRARWARSGRSISSCRPNSPWTKPSISWTRISAKATNPSRVAVVSMRMRRKGEFRSWCRVRRFHKPMTRAPINSFAASIESKAGNFPPQRSSTILIGEAADTGVAILPRQRVRTSWKRTGQR